MIKKLIVEKLLRKMKNFTRMMLLFLVVVGVLSKVEARFNPMMPIKHKDLYEKNACVEIFLDYHSVIDWTEGKVITQYSIPVTFRDSNIGRGMMNLTEKLKKKIILFAINVCGKIIISSSLRLQDYFDQDEEIKHKILSRLYESSLHGTTLKGSALFGSIIIPLFGKNGISELFYKYVNPKKVTLFLEKENVSGYVYNTLVIDTVMFPQFKPSLFAKILNQRGDIVHSVDTVNSDILLKRSPVIYVSSISDALHHNVAGDQIAYVLPHSIGGALCSDIILFDQDVQRIYSQERTIDHLFEGRVIIIKPKDSQL